MLLHHIPTTRSAAPQHHRECFNLGENYYVSIPLGDVALPLHLHTGDSPPQSPVGSARDFDSFLRFWESNMAKFIAASSTHAFFYCLFQDFPVLHGGIHRLLKALADGEQREAASPLRTGMHPKTSQIVP